MTSFNYHKVQHFCWNFQHVSYLTMTTKVCSGFCFALLRSWIINKNIKKRVCRTQVFFIFANNSRSKQNKKKYRTRFCRHWSVGNVCKVSAKCIELYGSWSSSKFSIFYTKSLVSRKQKSFGLVFGWDFVLLNKY